MEIDCRTKPVINCTFFSERIFRPWRVSFDLSELRSDAHCPFSSGMSIKAHGEKRQERSVPTHPMEEKGK